MKKPIALALAVVTLLCCLVGCSSYKVDKGYSYFGSLPSMFLGIRTNQTEYPLGCCHTQHNTNQRHPRNHRTKTTFFGTQISKSNFSFQF